ncbi:PC-Esterase [Sesbania bispinosa]|nr:PC-Esterase [Sesbania bispinosa]
MVLVQRLSKGGEAIGGMEAEIRRTEIEEVEAVKAKANEFRGFRFEVLDVTKLALLRPDGHPGPYMNPFPFAKGVQRECRMIVFIGACLGL